MNVYIGASMPVQSADTTVNKFSIVSLYVIGSARMDQVGTQNLTIFFNFVAS